eukprot:TRINITY_DN3796_c0_g1_i4.p2 TRINITY_DN3796_c0_g1~~TRINITY_DN3796_c0_g1_i4.p2  ORF type:complete len:304 (+),score=17.51 TRINITY_DN3796_c0_g1_i4:64-975(+)
MCIRDRYMGKSNLFGKMNFQLPAQRFTPNIIGAQPAISTTTPYRQLGQTGQPLGLAQTQSFSGLSVAAPQQLNMLPQQSLLPQQRTSIIASRQSQLTQTQILQPGLVQGQPGVIPQTQVFGSVRASVAAPQAHASIALPQQQTLVAQNPPIYVTEEPVYGGQVHTGQQIVIQAQPIYVPADQAINLGQIAQQSIVAPQLVNQSQALFNPSRLSIANQNLNFGFPAQQSIVAPQLVNQSQALFNPSRLSIANQNPNFGFPALQSVAPQLPIQSQAIHGLAGLNMLNQNVNLNTFQPSMFSQLYR